MASTFIAAFVATCLFASSAFKWRNLKEFGRAVDEYPLLAALPSVARTAAVVVVPLGEAALAALLVPPGTRLAGAAGAVCLGLCFVLLLAFDPRPAISHCGCWGVASADVPRVFHLARAGALLLGATVLLVIELAASATLPLTWELGIEAFALTAPFALLSLELPQIGQIVHIQQLARG